MKVGDRVKLKINGIWYNGEIICVYAVPKDYDLVDILIDTGETLRGISTKNVYSLEND